MANGSANPVDDIKDKEIHETAQVKLDLPRRWNPADTHPHLELSEDGLQVTNVGKRHPSPVHFPCL